MECNSSSSRRRRRLRRLGNNNNNNNNSAVTAHQLATNNAAAGNTLEHEQNVDHWSTALLYCCRCRRCSTARLSSSQLSIAKLLSFFIIVLLFFIAQKSIPAKGLFSLSFVTASNVATADDVTLLDAQNGAASIDQHHDHRLCKRNAAHVPANRNVPKVYGSVDNFQSAPFVASQFSTLSARQQHGFEQAGFSRQNIDNNLPGIMPADVPLIAYNISFAGGKKAAAVARVPQQQRSNFNFPSERDRAPAFEAASHDRRSRPSRRALEPKLLSQLDPSLVNDIARRVLPLVQSELHSEERKAIASVQPQQQQARSSLIKFPNETTTLTPRVGGVGRGPPSRFRPQQFQPATFGHPSMTADDEVPNDAQSQKSPRDLARSFAKPTLESTHRMRLATAMEEMTRAMKQQLHLSNEDVAVVLPQVDLENTMLGPMVHSGNFPQGKINFEGLASNVENIGDNDLAAAREFVRDFSNKNATSFSARAPTDEEFFMLAAAQQQQHIRVKRQAGCQRSPFRTIDGSCNNLNHPDWGRAFIAFKRYIVTPHYADGVSTPRSRSYNEQARRPNLPGPRLVSSIMHDGGDTNDDHITLMTAQWGQFVDHGITHTPISAVNDRGNLITPRCCNQNRKHNSCFEINVPRDDPFFSQFSQTCLEFVRSSPANTRLGAREQLNQVTSFIDGSQIYGSSADTARGLRNFRSGELSHVFRREADEELLPNDPGSSDCSNADASSGRVCFKAGDVRCNEQMALTAVQTMMLRLHNQVARALTQINPHWDDERSYQEARKIVSALLQHITYNEYLPVILGRDHLERFNLLLKREGTFDGYDAERNPTIANVFAAAAYRFGHSIVQGKLFMMDTNHQNVLSQNLAQSFFSPFMLHQAGRSDQVLRGLTEQNIQRFDRKVDPQVSNHLFESPGAPFGTDLAARNIARGRDHGLPGYNFWRKWCGLPVANTCEDLSSQVASDAIERLRRLYDNPSDVDLWTAGLSELPVAGGLVGPTFACIIGQQFQDLRVGDRYWYENPAPEGFTPDQLQQLRIMTLARVMCDTTNTVSIQKHVMLNVMNENGINPLTDCKAIPFMDLSKWKENGGGVAPNRNRRQPPPPPQQQPARREQVQEDDAFGQLNVVPSRDNFDRRTLQQPRPAVPFNFDGSRVETSVPAQFTQAQPFGGGFRNTGKK